MTSAVELIASLHSAPIRKETKGWGELFKGALSIAIKDTRPEDNCVRVEVAFATDPSDNNDYIWRDEIAAGETDKVKFIQSGGQGIKQSVVEVKRIGLHDPTVADRYELAFDIDPSTILKPVSLIFLWNDAIIAQADPP